MDEKIHQMLENLKQNKVFIYIVIGLLIINAIVSFFNYRARAGYQETINNINTLKTELSQSVKNIEAAQARISTSLADLEKNRTQLTQIDLLTQQLAKEFELNRTKANSQKVKLEAEIAELKKQMEKLKGNK